MMRPAVYGAVIGLSCAIPIVYSSNPDMFHRLASESQVVTERAELDRIEIKPEGVSYTAKSVVIPMKRSGHFVAEFRLNGRRVEAMIDTGATAVAINRSTARDAGIRLSNADFKYEVSTANGRTRAAVAKIDMIEIGKIRVRNVEAMVLEDKALSGTLIGMTFMKRLSSYGVEDNRMELIQ